MKKDIRTLQNLRQSIRGRIYIYIANREVWKQFAQNAEDEGYRFGNIKPTENVFDDIIALHRRKQLSHTGFWGHMAFRSDPNLTRIDYEKYINGCKHFLFVDNSKPLRRAKIFNRTYGKIELIGKDNCHAAALALKKRLKAVNDDDALFKLFDEIKREFDVTILYVE